MAPPPTYIVIGGVITGQLVMSPTKIIVYCRCLLDAECCGWVWAVCFIMGLFAAPWGAFELVGIRVPADCASVDPSMSGLNLSAAGD